MLRSCNHFEIPLPSLVKPFIATLLILTGSASASAQCRDTGVALQVLGSGGPFGAGRASAGYLVWIDGVSRIMVDAGGGTFTRFHEAGATIADLQLLALSHFHPDHAAEVPALLWPRGGALQVSGPSGNSGFPSVDDFFTGMVGPGGVFRILNERVTLSTIPVDVTSSDPLEILNNGGVRVRGIGVPHGSVPTVGYRVDVGDASIAFSSDQNGSNPRWTNLIRDVDVLVVHFAVPESATGTAGALHARPSVWGQMAADADVGTLVLSHLSATRASTREPRDFGDSIGHLRSRYDGPVIVADDLLCVSVD